MLPEHVLDYASHASDDWFGGQTLVGPGSLRRDAYILTDVLV